MKAAKTFLKTVKMYQKTVKTYHRIVKTYQKTVETYQKVRKNNMAISINKDFISTKNTYAGQNKPKYIVIHETDNFARGAGPGDTLRRRRRGI